MILLFGGTAETEPLACELSRNTEVLLSTATDTPLASTLSIRRRSGPLDRPQLEVLLAEERIRVVVLATHPYAQKVREMVSAVCTNADLPLVIYQRPAAFTEHEVFWAKDHDEAATLAVGFRRPILLTTGSTHLAPYIRAAREARLAITARILDHPSSRQASREAGLNENEIIEGRGPFSVSETIADLRKSRAGVLVTKDGGDLGGARDKLAAARKLGCDVVAVRRPEPPEGALDSVPATIQAVRTLLESYPYKREGGPPSRSRLWDPHL